MIFPGDSNAASKNGPQQQQSQPLYHSPPAYGASSYTVGGPQGIYAVFSSEDELHRRRRRRFILWAAVISIILWGFCRSTSSWNSGDEVDKDWKANPEDYPIPDHVELGHCTGSNDWSNIQNRPSLGLPYTGETHFDLPLNADTLFFVERGDLSGGTATVTTDSGLKDDQVHVKVVVHYRYDWVRNWAKVCQTTRGTNEHGIGIFTPNFKNRRSWNHRLSFDIVISFPTSVSEHVIRKFETELHNTRQHIEKLHNYAFSSINLQGTNGGIVADDLSFTDGVFRTSNGAITGQYNTTKALSIQTTNGKVDVLVGADAGKAVTPKIVVASTNGGVQAGFSLTATKEKGSEFDITTTTTNGKLDVRFDAQPLESILRFKGTTSNGQAKLLLNPAFEGTFEAHTSNAQTLVAIDENISDPAGKGRNRRIYVVSSKKTDVHGSVYWSDKDDVSGSVSLKTTNGHLSLQG